MALAGDTTTERAALGLIVAITDLSVESERALSRAALLAAQHRAPLRLVYFAGGGKSHYPDPQARLVQRCRALGRQHNIVIEPADNADATLKSVKAAAVGADLLVMHHSLCGKLDGLVKRSVIDQLLRASRCPVLVVKGPATEPFRHTLVALDLKAGSEHLLTWGLLGGQSTRMSVFHALDNQVMRPSAATDHAQPALSLDERRAAERQLAQVYLREVIDQHVPPGQAADIFVAYGEPARELVSLQSARGINLTVIGKRDASLMRDVLQRSKGQRVLNQSTGDVLVSTRHHAAATG